MKIKRRRVERIRDELRLWLRRRHGVHKSYAKADIDHGREELGFDGVDDALIAYSLFGYDLVPDFVESMGISDSAAEIDALVGSLSGEIAGITDLLGVD